MARRTDRRSLEALQQPDVPLVVQFLQDRDRAAQTPFGHPVAQDGPSPGGGNVLPRRVQLEAVARSDGLELARPPVAEHQRALVGDRQQRALLQRLVPVGHQQVFVEGAQHAQPLALGAGPGGVVEREAARLQLGQVHMPVGAGAQGRKRPLLAFPLEGLRPRQHRHHAFGQPQGGLDPLAQTRQGLLLDLDAVEHQFQRVVLVALQFLDRLQVVQFAVDAREPIALRLPLLLFGAVLALATPHHRRQQQTIFVRSIEQQAVGDLPRRTRLDRLVAFRTSRFAQPRVQQSQVVQDLGGRPHGRTRIAVHRLLVDADGGRNPLHAFHRRLSHLADELARVARQALDVPPLPLAENGIEG